MPEYLHPGVYIEEQPAPQTIEGVSTSTAGFVGATEKGPTDGLPVLVTSFAEFTRVFGGYLPAEPWQETRYLPHAVEGFFANGGQRVYVRRVYDSTAAAAALTLNDGFATRLLESLPEDQTKWDTVKLASLRGIQVGTTLVFTETIGGAPTSKQGVVSAYERNPDGWTVTLDARLPNRFTAAGCVVTINGQSRPGETGTFPRLDIKAKSFGAWGQAVSVATTDVDGVTGLTKSAGTETLLSPIEIELAFATVGPDVGAVMVALASTADLRAGDVVEFANPSGQRERRTVDTTAANEIVWAGTGEGKGGLVNRYSADGSTVSLVTAIRGPVDLAFDATAGGPAAGDESVLLDAASFDRLVDGDRVEFANPDGEREVRQITKATDATTQISWSGADNGPLEHDFTAAESTVRLVFPSAEVEVKVVDSTGFAEEEKVRISRGTDSQVLSIAAGGVPDATTIRLNTETTPIERSYLAGDPIVHVVAGSGRRLDLRSTSNFYDGAVIEVDDGTSKGYYTVDTVDGQSLVLTSNLAADVLSGVAVRTVEFNLTINDGTTTETFANLSMNPDAANYVDRVVTTSRLVTVRAVVAATNPPHHLPRTPDARPANLQGGNDGGKPVPADYRGVDNGPEHRTGIKALADIDVISIIAAPGISDASVQGELIEQCALLKDRFAVVDPPLGATLGNSDPDLNIETLRGQHDTTYAAMYYPWLQIPDPFAPRDRPATMLVPPSGHMIGIYARVDVERGVHKAPANEVVRGVTGLELALTDRDQDILNPMSINVIRDFRNTLRGIRVWGSRVMTSDSAWRYVSVRRLFLFIEESLFEGLQWVVFEPNAEPLWARVRQTVAGFLRRVWRDGALAGVTEDEAFFVRCDRSTMTEDDIRNGRLFVIVGARPVFPAEFVIVRISQKTLEATG